MNLHDVFASAIVRRLAYVLVAGVLAWVGMGRAHAQIVNACPQGSLNNTCSKASAYNEAVRIGASQTICIWGGQDYTVTGGAAYIVNNSTIAWTSYSVCIRNGVTVEKNLGILAYYYFVCPSGRTWSDVTKTCVLVCPADYKEDPFNPGTCMSSDKCQALNSGLGSATRTLTGTTQCKASCLMGFPGGHKKITVSGATDELYTGVLRYLGPSCPSSVPPTTEDVEAVKTVKPQECLVRDGSLDTVCVKSNGDRCHSASNGKQLCWTPGETGEKTDGSTKQVTNAGPNAIAPPLTLSNGDTLAQSKPPTTATSTNTTNTTTTTTTTTNYNTTNGTNAAADGGTGTGEPSDGTGSSPDTETENSGAGGIGCAPSDKPVVAGDPLLGLITLQTWATRCAVESKDAVTSTGDVGDCATNFTVTGPEKSAEVIKLKGLREQLCGVDKNLKDGDPNGTGSVDGVGLEGEHDGSAVVEGEALGADGLDSTGFGFSRACPNMPSINFMGTSVQFDNSVMCNWLSLGGTFVMMLAALASLRILAGVR